MKELKYILLFEKFKSSKLSKTLGYIKDDSEFIMLLKKVAMAYDFPLSELSDDMFEYLPFKQALMFKNDSESIDKKCEAESEWIPGEKCQGGKIKRTWGKGFRMVNCESCGGTGIKKVTSEGKLNCIKFWFDSEGKYVYTTAMDGTTISIDSSGNTFKKGSKSYIEGQSFRPSQIPGSNLKTGDLVKMRKGGEDWIGTIYRNGGHIYLIQNQWEGSEPSGTDWQKYGSLSWSLGSDDHGNITILTPIDRSTIVTTDEGKKVDPYTFNFKVLFGRNKITLDKDYNNLEDTLSDAHFALILDINKLTESGFKVLTDTKKDRKELKSGATSLKSDEDIRSENIERYIDTLATKFNVAEGLHGITKVLPRMLGGKNCLYYIYTGSQFKKIDNLIGEVYEFIKEKDESYKKDIAESIISSVRDTFRKNMQTDRHLKVNKKSILDDLKQNESLSNHLLIFNELESLSLKIYEKILKSDIQTLEDMEIVFSKLDNIRLVMWKSRYTLTTLRSYFEYITYSSYRTSYNSLMDLRKSSLPDIVNDIKIISNIVDKM